MDKSRKTGLIVALSCYTIWGLLPIFWKLLSGIPAAQVQVNRMFWCFVCVLAFCLIARRDFRALFHDRRAVGVLLLSGALCTLNWTTYVITVNSGNIVESAMGYYITPLFNILSGMLLFHERLTPGQTIATVLAAAGVIFFALNYGKVPVLGLLLAISFSAYGAVKKWGGYPAVEGMAVESTFTGLAGLLGIAVGFAVPGLFATLTPVTDVSSLAYTGSGAGLIALFAISGFATWLPLQLFSHAANAIPLTWLGFCQYWSPTLALCVGVFLFGEPFTFAHGVLFACLWAGIAVIAVETVVRARRTPRDAS